MELKEYIKTAISDLTDAIGELQAELKNGAIISPSMPTVISTKTIRDPENKNINRVISDINFDVATTVENSDKIGGEAKGGIHIFSASIDGENENRYASVSRITFTIPVVLPTWHVKSDREIYECKKPQRPNS